MKNETAEFNRPFDDVTVQREVVNETTAFLFAMPYKMRIFAANINHGK